MSRPPHTAPIEVLLVEDDPNDVALTLHVLEGAKLRNLPDLILLDLNLPKLDGREVLEQIKRDERLRPIPVIVVTSSSADEDVAKSHRLNANAFVTKPIDPAVFLKAVNAIGRFWLEIVKLS